MEILTRYAPTELCTIGIYAKFCTSTGSEVLDAWHESLNRRLHNYADDIITLMIVSLIGLEYNISPDVIFTYYQSTQKAGREISSACSNVTVQCSSGLDGMDMVAIVTMQELVQEP